MRIARGVLVAGRYRLEKPLARGGMGSVWVARHTGLDAPVAIKFMDAALASSSTARARFEREAKAAAQISSPHIVGVHDYGIEDETAYLVMELLQGEDLGSRIKRSGPMPLAVAADVIAQVARALRVAHAAGIVHRDLKPGNVFLVPNDDQEIAKVLDFGIAKVEKAVDEDEATTTDQLLGSPQYMSPEQTRSSRDVDARSDLWALGVIAYRIITGKLPFSGELGDVLVKICTEPAPPPSVHNPELSPTIDRFFERALAKSPDHRFQTATALAQTFALAAGVNLPAVDRDPPRKKLTSTQRLDGMTAPSPDAATARRAASRESISPVTLTPAPADAPTRPTLGTTASEPAPESTTQPRLTRTHVDPEPSAGAPRSLPTPTVEFAGPAPILTVTEKLPQPPEPEAPPVTAPASPPPLDPVPVTRAPKRSALWTIATAVLALGAGGLLARSAITVRPAAAIASSVPAAAPPATISAVPVAEPEISARRGTGSSPDPTAPARSSLPAPPASASVRALPVALVAAPSAPPRAPRATPVAVTVPAPKPTEVAAAPVPPPAAAPPPQAAHRLFGTEN